MSVMNLENQGVRELSLEETNEVGGGVIPVLAAIVVRIAVSAAVSYAMTSRPQ